MLPSPPDPVLSPPGFFAALLSDLRPRHLVTAAVLLGLAALLVRFVNLAFARTLAKHRERGTLLPETATQLALSRRLITFAIWVVAIGISASQFPELRVLSAGLLASAGLSGLVVGFAARGTLGNAIAGLTISIAQPIRIGDDIEFRGDRGVVEDIHLIYTVLRLVDGKRLVVPNDTMANEVTKNLTMGGVTRVTRADVLVPPNRDAAVIRSALLAVAHGFEALDREAVAPEVYYVRIDERGTLLRLVATCADASAADRLGQKILARGAALAFRTSL